MRSLLVFLAGPGRAAVDSLRLERPAAPETPVPLGRAEPVPAPPSEP